MVGLVEAQAIEAHAQLTTLPLEAITVSRVRVLSHLGVAHQGGAAAALFGLARIGAHRVFDRVVLEDEHALEERSASGDLAHALHGDERGVLEHARISSCCA
jgi:hypothetical protein